MEKSLYIACIESEVDYPSIERYNQEWMDGNVTFQIGCEAKGFRLENHETTGSKASATDGKVRSLVLLLVEHEGKRPTKKQLAQSLRPSLESPWDIRPKSHRISPRQISWLGKWHGQWDFDQ